jgi:ElaB/YqjD/DUF883 family membrane-anchored ribosome-binding protein
VDEEPRTGRTEVGAEGTPEEPRDPEQIKREIEETRGELGDTVEALAEKADVKAQAREKVEQTKEELKSKVSGAGEKIGGVTPESAQQGAAQVADRARSQPLPFAVAGAFAAGVLVGMLIKRSRD